MTKQSTCMNNIMQGQDEEEGETPPGAGGGVRSSIEPMLLVELSPNNDDSYSISSASSLKAPGLIRTCSSDVGASGATVFEKHQSFVLGEECIEHDHDSCRGTRIHQVSSGTSPYHEDGRHAANFLRG